MSNAQWPASLPQSYLLLGGSETAPNLILRTQMDAGPAKTRKRFTAGVRQMRVQWLMSRSQKDTFDAFYRVTLGGGALPFDYRRQDQDAQSGLAGFGSCLQFNGRGTYVLVPDHAALSPGSSTFTIEFWYRANDPNEEAGILHKSGLGQMEYAVEKAAGDDILVFRAYALNGDNAYYGTGVIPDTEWHHWAFACDGSNHYLYRDGTLIQTAAKLSGDMSGGTAPLEIGRSLAYGTYGRIDDVRLWADARSDVEIAGNMMSELVGDESDLIAYWRFNEGSGITTADSQTSGNHDGTIIGATWVPLVEEMRIVSPPQYSPVSHEYWHVETELEVLP